MEYLHKSPLKVHGMLKSSNCLLNIRWTLKISEFGIAAYRVTSHVTEREKYSGKLSMVAAAVDGCQSLPRPKLSLLFVV